MAVHKAKRSNPLAQPHRRSSNPEQILRPKYGLRISPAGSQPRQARPHAQNGSTRAPPPQPATTSLANKSPASTRSASKRPAS